MQMSEEKLLVVQKRCQNASVKSVSSNTLNNKDQIFEQGNQGQSQKCICIFRGRRERTCKIEIEPLEFRNCPVPLSL